MGLKYLDLYQFFNLGLVGVTNIVSTYLIVIMMYWTVRLRRSRSNLKLLIFSLVIAKVGVWLWTFSSILEIVVKNIEPPTEMLPAKIFFFIGVLIQFYVTTRIRPAPRIASADLSVELRTGGRMILIVDDEEPLCRIYRRVLEAAGFNSEFATSGMDALVIMEHEKPCLLIVDIGLPDMDGVEFASKARAGGYDGPIVAISGIVRLINEEKLSPARFDAIMTKPIRAAELVREVSKWI